MQTSWRNTSSTEKGFTLFEVIVAGFVAILFFLLVLQASSLGSISKAQAQEASEILSWMQKDIEAVKAAASSLHVAMVSAAQKDMDVVTLANANDELKFTTGDIIEFVTANPDGERYTIKSANVLQPGAFWLTSKLKATYPANSLVRVVARQVAQVSVNIPAGSASVLMSQTQRISVGDEIVFGTTGLLTSATSTIYTKADISRVSYPVSSVSTGIVTLKRNLSSPLDISNTVNISLCNASSKYSGYGDVLRDVLAGKDEVSDSSAILLDSSMTKTSKGKQYTIKRIMEPMNIPPYNILQVHYEINPTLSQVISLNSFVNRVIPDVVFYCN